MVIRYHIKYDVLYITACVILSYVWPGCKFASTSITPNVNTLLRYDIRTATTCTGDRIFQFHYDLMGPPLPILSFIVYQDTCRV